LTGIYFTVTAQNRNCEFFSVKDSKLISPGGEPVNLCGWRINYGAWSIMDGVLFSDFQKWKAQGLLGNAQGVEIWWSREMVSGSKESPSEGFPHRPGEYNADGLVNLLETMRNIARSGSWIIPSIRVSYDQAVAKENARKGINTWQGWADHIKVINNQPVIVEEGVNAGTYGRHRDRFFAWLDWIIPKILEDEEIASHIAYWEMWHYFGHKHGSSSADRDQYLDDFLPRLIEQYRKHDPDRLLGVGLTLDATVNQLNSRLEAGTWSPYEDKNLIYICGGYGILRILMGPDNTVKNTSWPNDSKNPTWIQESQEFNIEKFIRLSGCTMHSQEGPGLRECFRETPIPALQRTWLTGLYNLYNAVTNGYGFHAWPPSWADQQNSNPLFNPSGAFDETDFFNLTREALKGNQINLYTSIKEIPDASQVKFYAFPGKLIIEGLTAGQKVEVYSLTGSLVSIVNPTSGKFEIELPNGIYCIRTGEYSQKIIMQ
jgi:hypothetical protein